MDEEQLQGLLNRLQELHLETGEILSKIEQATGSQKTEDKAPPRSGDGFNPGDPVYITNRIQNIPIGRRVTTADRAAIVRKVSGDRVYFTTATGKETWRTAKNLKRISSQDYNRLSKLK